MSDLLQTAVTAHGGIDRWNRFTRADLDLSITGAIWHVKSRPDVLKNITMQVDLVAERVTTQFTDVDRRTVFEPDLVTVMRTDGTVVESREDPERSFAGHRLDTPWDDVHVAYFSGEALWTYITTPFLYTRPGFVSQEIAPIEVDGQTWRRLRVTFPDSVKSHTRVQVSCFGPDGLLRRHDYTVDVLGGGTGANYALDHREVDGITVPMTRRIYAWEGDHQVVPEPVLVAVDISRIAFS